MSAFKPLAFLYSYVLTVLASQLAVASTLKQTALGTSHHVHDPSQSGIRQCDDIMTIHSPICLCDYAIKPIQSQGNTSGLHLVMGPCSQRDLSV